MATENNARFTINGTPSEAANGDRGFDATPGQVLTIRLEQNPAANALTAKFEIPDPANSDGPFSSLFDTQQTFDENAASSILLGTGGLSINDEVHITIDPGTEISSYVLRNTVVTANGSEVYERMIVVRESGLRMSTPSERQEYSQRGWSDALNELTKAVFTSGGLVTSVFGRTGAVIAVAGDYVTSLITNDSAKPGATLNDVLNATAALTSTETPAALDGTTVGAIGASVEAARADHAHSIAGILSDANPASLLSTVSTPGTSLEASRSDHQHVVAYSVPASTAVQVGNGIGLGSAATYSRSDHQHAVATGTPSNIGAANAQGSSLLFPRLDHVHAHGDQAGGTLHALATVASHGFMSATDKQAIDNVSGWIGAGSVDGQPLAWSTGSSAWLPVGNVFIEDGVVRTRQFHVLESDGGTGVTIVCPAVVSDWTMTLPDADANEEGARLVDTGSGTLDWEYKTNPQLGDLPGLIAMFEADRFAGKMTKAAIDPEVQNWTKTNMSVVGAAYASKTVSAIANGASYIDDQPTDYGTSGTLSTFETLLVQGSSGFCYIEKSSGSTWRQYFDLSTPAVGTLQNDTNNEVVDATIVDLGGGLLRVRVLSHGTGIGYRIGLSDDGSTTFASTGSSMVIANNATRVYSDKVEEPTNLAQPNLALAQSTLNLRPHLLDWDNTDPADSVWAGGLPGLAFFGRNEVHRLQADDIAGALGGIETGFALYMLVKRLATGSDDMVLFQFGDGGSYYIRVGFNAGNAFIAYRNGGPAETRATVTAPALGTLDLIAAYYDPVAQDIRIGRGTVNGNAATVPVDLPFVGQTNVEIGGSVNGVSVDQSDSLVTAGYIFSPPRDAPMDFAAVSNAKMRRYINRRYGISTGYS